MNTGGFLNDVLRPTTDPLLIHGNSHGKYRKTPLAQNAENGGRGHDSDAHANEVIMVDELSIHAVNTFELQPFPRL